MEEIWKPIIGYEGLYEVSNLGRVKSLFYSNQHVAIRRDKILKPTKYFYYSCVDLRKKGTRKVKKIHRLVAEAFIPRKEGKHCVLHIDESIDSNGFASNSVSNLYWGTIKENNLDKLKKGRDNNPMKQGRFIFKKGSESHLAKKVIQYSIEGVFIKEWGCVGDIALFYKISNHSVYSAICGRSKTCMGFIWSYL